MAIPKWIFIIIHLAMVSVSGAVLLFSTNLTVLTIVTLIVLVMFCACVYFDGCLTTKAEDVLPIIEIKPTEVVKRVFFVDNAIEMKDMEKVLIGLTLVAYLSKVAILYTLRELYGMTYMRFLSTLAAQKGGYGQVLYSLLV